MDQYGIILDGYKLSIGIDIGVGTKYISIILEYTYYWFQFGILVKVYIYRNTLFKTWNQ